MGRLGGGELSHWMRHGPRPDWCVDLPPSLPPSLPQTFIEYAIDYSRANAPLAQDLYADDEGSTGLFLSSPLARCVTGVTMYVDNGLHAMGMALDSIAMQQE